MSKIVFLFGQDPFFSLCENDQNTSNVKDIYFIVSGEIIVYLVKIKVVLITSEMISYHFTIVTDTIYIFTARFGRLRFSSLFQKWMLPPLQIFEHL